MSEGSVARLMAQGIVKSWPKLEQQDTTDVISLTSRCDDPYPQLNRVTWIYSWEAS